MLTRLAQQAILLSFFLSLIAGPYLQRSGRARSPSVKNLFEMQDTWAASMIAARAAFRQATITGKTTAGRALKPFDSGPVLGPDEARPLDLDIRGAQWMTLSTRLEKGTANCNIWGNAILVAEDGTETKLSDLDPANVVVGWGQLIRNKNWEGRQLQIGKRTFSHGIWIHANSDVSYKLQNQFIRFRCNYGIDARRPVGRARFVIRFDHPVTRTAIWNQLKRRYKNECTEFEKDAGRNFLEWFSGPGNTMNGAVVVGRVAGQLGPWRESINKQLAAFSGESEGDRERACLALYRQACRLRAYRQTVATVQSEDLRGALDTRADRLVTAGETDSPSWGFLMNRVEEVAKVFPDDVAYRASAMPGALGRLASIDPDRFSGARAVADKWAEAMPEYEHALEMVSGSEPDSIEALQRSYQKGRRLFNELLRTMPGMRDVLARATPLDLTKEWGDQYRALQYDLQRRDRFRSVADTTLNPESLIQEQDRDPADIVIRRTAALLHDLSLPETASRWQVFLSDLEQLARLSKQVPLSDPDARYLIYLDSCRLRRQVAFENPLIDFQDILFIKRHRALFNHMCDQYYGMAATPGGGLYVLEDAFGAKTRVRDVLQNADVASGPMHGKRLSGGSVQPPSLVFDGQGNLRGEPSQGGSFLSPDLSFDGKKVVFAYVECLGDMLHDHHTDPTRGHWDEGRCYHLFSANLDGTDLQQLTSGTWNDFDPCWLPNGRIAFISERRGGYLRCGRVCPTYTLFDMAHDGQDVSCLSYHETNEWQPSVSNDGMIVWTRWDYVDRHGCTAHMPWLTTPDGRDPRPVHGNYSPREVRPDMEVDCRAIPSSGRYIATAAPHHGQAFGSLVIIDPDTPDDDGMGPIRRITPEVDFPESQRGGQVYGTPWPLSEKYYLAVYDRAMQPGQGRQGRAFVRGNYGIYLVDAFGNRELLYRDDEIGSLSPIPVRPRTRPPVVTDVALRDLARDPTVPPAEYHKQQPATGTVAVMNVYESLRPWPDQTEITALRVLQVLPMSVPSGRPPHETALRVASAGDSVVPVRHVLGTVPVEEDGSVFFTAPADVELFFQVLDKDGLAVQSMRSATQVRPGDHLVCAGCHAPRRSVGLNRTSSPLALQRVPSDIRPEISGANPFSYPRIVQPVLDKHCVSCHAPGKKAPLNLTREPLAGRWFASYDQLVRRFGFHDYGEKYRTMPGRFGARASGLYQLLKAGHYDVKLDPEEMHRITLWLDCTSMFYGVYERDTGERQLQGKVAFPTLE